MAKASLASVLRLLPLAFLLPAIVREAAARAATPCTPPPCRGKQRRPELVGKDQDAEYRSIRRENPQVTDAVYLISGATGARVPHRENALGAAGDGDFCCNRVVVVLGALPSGGEGVVRVPQVG